MTVLIQLFRAKENTEGSFVLLGKAFDDMIDASGDSSIEFGLRKNTVFNSILLILKNCRDEEEYLVARKRIVNIAAGRVVIERILDAVEFGDEDLSRLRRCIDAKEWFKKLYFSEFYLAEFGYGKKCELTWLIELFKLRMLPHDREMIKEKVLCRLRVLLRITPLRPEDITFEHLKFRAGLEYLRDNIDDVIVEVLGGSAVLDPMSDLGLFLAANNGMITRASKCE